MPTRLSTWIQSGTGAEQVSSGACDAGEFWDELGMCSQLGGEARRFSQSPLCWRGEGRGSHSKAPMKNSSRRWMFLLRESSSLPGLAL